jgi:outer membrane protein TolC
MLVAAGEATNPAMRRARADYEAARAGIDVAAALPPVGVAVDLQRAFTNVGGNPRTYGFTVDWPNELWGKRPAKAFRASQQANVAALAIARTRWDVRSEVTTAAVDLAAARARLEAVRSLASVLTDWEKALEESVSLGESARLEQLTVARERASYERDEAAAQRQVAVAEATLGQALAIPGAQLRGIPLRAFPKDFPAIPALPKLTGEAALHRLDVLQGLGNYAVADATLRLEILNQYPDVRLTSGLSYDQGQNKWQLGPSVTVLPDLNRATIAQARATRKAKAAAFEEIQSTALGEVSAAGTAYQGSLGQLARWPKNRAKSLPPNRNS